MITTQVPFLDMKHYAITSVSTILATLGAKEGKKKPIQKPHKDQQTISSYLLGKDKSTVSTFIQNEC